MPTTHFEIAATNCEVVGQILDAGIASYVAGLDQARDFVFTCSETIELSPSASQIFLRFYILFLIPTLIGWAILYRRGAKASEFFEWGIVAVVVPIIGPLVSPLSFVKIPTVLGRVEMIRYNQETGNRHANDPF